MGRYAKKVIRGASALLSVNGIVALDVKQFTATISIEREDVPVPGSDDIDSAKVGQKGTWEMTTNKVYTRAADFIEEIKANGDPVLDFVMTYNSRDNGAIERLVIEDANLEEFILGLFEAGEMTEETYSGNFVVGDSRFTDVMDYPEDL